jgi:hypothetical protein
MPEGINPTLERLQQGSAARTGEKLDWSYYDTYSLLSTLLTVRLFTVPLGGGANKTLADTNLETAGMIPQAQRLTIKAIKLIYTSDAALVTADIQFLYSLLDTTSLTFKMTGKDSLLTIKLNELVGSCLNAAVIPTVAGDNLPFIAPLFRGVFKLNIPIVLAALAPFDLRIEHHTAPNAALDGNRIQISLNGRLERLS